MGEMLMGSGPRFPFEERPAVNAETVNAQLVPLMRAIAAPYTEEWLQQGLANAAPVVPKDTHDYAGFIIAYAFGQDDLVRHLGFRSNLTPLASLRATEGRVNRVYPAFFTLVRAVGAAATIGACVLFLYWIVRGLAFVTAGH